MEKLERTKKQKTDTPHKTKQKYLLLVQPSAVLFRSTPELEE